MVVLAEGKRTKAEIAFDKATRAAFADWQRNEKAVFRKIDDVLKDYQAEILGNLAGGTEWDLARAETVRKSIEGARALTDARIRNLWRDEANKAAVLAMAKVDGPLTALGLPVEFIQAGVSLPQLAVLQDYVPTLIQDVTQETQRRVSNLMQHAVLGGMDQRELMRQVGTAVGPLSSKKRPDRTVFSNTHVRARKIMRTEMNRLNNLAMTHRVHGVATAFPGVGVKWLHRQSPDPRRGHSALHGVVAYPAEGGKFKLVGSDGTEYLVDGPHDPSLPGEHSINCHCGLQVVYNSERGKAGAKDSPYIQGDGGNIPDAGGVDPEKKGAQPEDRRRKVEEEIRKNKFETGVLFDDDGGIVFRKKGNENSVTFSKAHLEKMKNRVLTHNHPRGSSFSPADLFLTARHELKGIRAIGTNGLGDSWRHKARFTRPGGMSTDELISALARETKEAEQSVMSEMVQKIQHGEISVTEANTEYWHLVWTQVSSKNEWLVYEREALK